MRVVLVSVAAISVAACGGGSSGGISPPDMVRDAELGGFWVGFATYADQTSEEMVGISTADGRFVLITIDTFGPDTFGQYIGNATADGSIVSGNGRAYAPPGRAWASGATVLDFTLTAEINEFSAVTGSWETSSGDVGEFSLDYDADYERDSSLTLVEGVWQVYDAMLNPTLTLTVEADGSFTGQNVVGCQSIGQVSIIDSAFNVYGWDVTIGNCPIAGDYTGLASLGDVDTGDPANSENNALLVSISNDVRALLLPLER